MPISSSLRERLARPFGEVMEFAQVERRLRERRPVPLIAVGDQTILHLLDADLSPDIGIYDLICQRREVPLQWKQRIEAAARREGGAMRTKNPPGTIQASLESLVRDCLLVGRGWIEIEGEDDLAALVAMACAADGAVVLYGQPNVGVVWVVIDERKRAEAQELLREIRRE